MFLIMFIYGCYIKDPFFILIAAVFNLGAEVNAFKNTFRIKMDDLKKK